MSPHTYLPTSPRGAFFVKIAILFGRKAAIFFSRNFDFGLSHVTSVSKTVISAIISFSLKHTQKVKRPIILLKLFLGCNRRPRRYICGTVAVQGPTIQLPYKLGNKDFCSQMIFCCCYLDFDHNHNLCCRLLSPTHFLSVL